MKKVIKLILIAAVLVGAVIGLMYVIAPSNNDEGIPDVTSATAKEWKEKIQELCKEGNWTEDGFKKIESGIHTDRVTSQGELISMDEEAALQKYLFTASCSYLNKQVNNLFKQSNYPDKTIKSSEDMRDFLSTKLEKFGSNSNLTEASNILSEYRQLLGAITFNSNASYSRPLRAYNAISTEAARSRVNALKYYKSHFSNNPTIRSQVDNLAYNRSRAEADYYSNLERAIENHFKSLADKDVSILLTDQVRFDEISSNEDAKRRLESFITHNHY